MNIIEVFKRGKEEEVFEANGKKWELIKTFYGLDLLDESGYSITKKMTTQEMVEAEFKISKDKSQR